MTGLPVRRAIAVSCLVVLAGCGPSRGRGADTCSADDPTCNGGGNESVDAGPACAGTQTRCGTKCVDVASDPQNCGACFTVCLPGQTCNNGCQSLPTTCPATGCPAGSYCDPQNRCVAGCQSDANCAAGRICLANGCQPGCRSDAACPRGQLCDQLQCRAACSSNADCPLEQICYQNTRACIAGCDSDSRCSAGHVCLNGQCQAGCRSNTDCPREQICSNSTRTCIAGCQDDSTCNTGRICVSGQCRAGCRADSTCGSGQICDASTHNCRAGCRSDSSCPKEQVCNTSQAQCTAGCGTSDAKCNTGRICVAGQCRAGCRTDATCGTGSICDATTLQCRAGCRADAGCALGSYCNTTTLVCTSGCNGNSARCAEGQACVGYTDGSYRCSGQCSSWGYECNGASWECMDFANSNNLGFCRRKCGSSTDCPSGQVCVWFMAEPSSYGDYHHYCAKSCAVAGCDETFINRDPSYQTPCSCAAAGDCENGGETCYATAGYGL
jgi:hypothetical protein